MKYPFRIQVRFPKEKPKLETILYISRFLSQEAKGEWAKYNIIENDSKDFVGIEIAFASNADAILFRLGYDNGQNIKAKDFSQRTDRKEA